jgi:hypothetical protein
MATFVHATHGHRWTRLRNLIEAFDDADALAKDPTGFGAHVLEDARTQEEDEAGASAFADGTAGAPGAPAAARALALPTIAEESRPSVGRTRRLSSMKSQWKECGFSSAKEAEKARKDAIIAAVHEDSKQEWQDSCPAFLADKRLGQRSGLEEAWSRVQGRVDAAEAARDVKLWGGFSCLGWETMRDKFFNIMQAFVKETPTRTGDRGEHSQSTAVSSERSTLLARLRNDWTRALSAHRQRKEMLTADKAADAENAERKRRFVNDAASSRRLPRKRLNMDDASEQVGDEGTFTTPGGDAATEAEDFVPGGTRNKKAKTPALDPAALRDAAREAHEKREANEERRHAEKLEVGERQHAESLAQTNKGLEQEAGFRREEIDLEKRKVEATERQGAEINEVKQDLAGVKATVGALAQAVEKQGEK